MTHATSRHAPVMLREAVEALSPRDGGIYVDGTFGAGGYSRAVLEKARCKVYAIDRDESVEKFARALEKEFAGRFVFLLGRFSDMCALLQAQGVERVDGIMLDIGVSSMQLDEAERGFSFRTDGPLDMRMGSGGRSAADIVNEAEEEELADILYHFGEEKASRRIARAIVAARAEKPIERTGELAEIIHSVLPKHGKTDPATRSFQALRIAVNDELEELKTALTQAERLLAPQGRLVVVSFHSLEDRIVKQTLHSRCGKTAGGSRHQPVLPDAAGPPGFFLPRPEKQTAGDEETARNPRARSATLRVAIRTEHGARL